MTENDHKSDMGFASVPAVQQYLDMAASRGVDCTRALQEAGISAHTMADSNKRVPGASLQKLLAVIIPQTNDPCFGLHTSAFIKPAFYGVLGYIAMNCSTLGEALAKTPVYEKIVGDMGYTTTRNSAEAVWVHWHCNFDQPLVRRHVIENVLSSWTRYVRWITGEFDKSPRKVCFEHSAPAPEWIPEYEAVFNCPVLFDQPCSALQVDYEYLEQPIRQADTQLLKTLEDHATDILSEIDKDQPLKYRVSNLLRLMVKKELPRKELIAEKLGMNIRTLQRRLREEGTGYQEILDDLRQELARNYLENSRLSIDEISALLGFAEPRSFHRSFKKWVGVTPGAYRSESSFQAH
ncbi:MAG: AraC family transcriptional regulator [Ketobacteraceae bacterium]|nr:AraC family transcriptional regulator [Ketobacteraceae bacterium]